MILVKQGVGGDDCDHPDDEHDVGVPRNLDIIVILLQQLMTIDDDSMLRQHWPKAAR